MVSVMCTIFASSPAVSCASSRSSAKNSADENAAGAPKADHVYSMPKPVSDLKNLMDPL